ncbi:APC family permease [Croceicoccus sediminis]|uniref:APC family permease n=1 Tax=Croceicoccus sediminis TaxID=2571150 RepID=UPI001478753E|nr:APC family permease [Croceicoccus sediminis]
MTATPSPDDSHALAVGEGRIGAVRIASLGVGLVVAGQFAGWNYGLASGFASFAVAAILMAVMCFGLALCVAELATMLPSAGGLHAYCEEAFGPSVGLGVGLAIAGALTASTGMAAEFINSYAAGVLGIDGLPLKVALFAFILAVHLRGVGEALGVLLFSGAVAVAALLAFAVGVLPSFSLANLIGAGAAPLGLAGVFGAIPFALFLFISVEQTATAAQEARDPARDVSRGMLAAIVILLTTATCVVVAGTGAVGPDALAGAVDPLAAALAAVDPAPPSWLHPVVQAGAVMGLVATFFSLVYGASRMIWAMAEEGYLPRVLGSTNGRGAPWIALVLVVVLGFPSTVLSPDIVVLAMVLLLSGSYVVTLSAYIRLRRTRPDAYRAFHAPGGSLTAGIALVLAMVVFASALLAGWQLGLALITAIVLAVALDITVVRRGGRTAPHSLSAKEP